MQEWTPEQLQKELDAGHSVFLKFWQRGCGPCKLSEGATKRLEENERFKDIIFGQICMDDFPEMGETANVETLPTFFLFHNQKLLGKHIGFKGLKNLENFIIQHFENIS